MGVNIKIMRYRILKNLGGGFFLVLVLSTYALEVIHSDEMIPSTFVHTQDPDYRNNELIEHRMTDSGSSSVVSVFS